MGSVRVIKNFLSPFFGFTKKKQTSSRHSSSVEYSLGACMIKVNARAVDYFRCCFFTSFFSFFFFYSEISFRFFLFIWTFTYPSRMINVHKWLKWRSLTHGIHVVHHTLRSTYRIHSRKKKIAHERGHDNHTLEIRNCGKLKVWPEWSLDTGVSPLSHASHWHFAPWIIKSINHV